MIKFILVGISLIGMLVISSIIAPYIFGLIVIGMIIMQFSKDKKPVYHGYNEKEEEDDSYHTDRSNEIASIKQKSESGPIERHESISKPMLKNKGNAYERHIGKRFENNGDLVVYNGFIRGYDDGGVDLIAISHDTKTINLIQCKNWQYKTIELEHVEKIYRKLCEYNLDFLHLSTTQIKSHLDTKKDDTTIQKILSHARHNTDQYTLRKTLYISSERVVDLEIGKFLTMIKPHIFRYEDMKIVVEKISS